MSEQKQYHFHSEAQTNEDFDSFAKRLLTISKKIRHWREDKLDREEVYMLACSHKYMGPLFEEKYNDDSVDIAARMSPIFTSDFNGILITVSPTSTVEELNVQYEKKVPVPRMQPPKEAAVPAFRATLGKES